MVPVEGYVLRRVTLPLQLISSHLATWFLQSVGVPVVRQGNVIDLGVRQLQVVAACSGLRYILSLFALVIHFLLNAYALSSEKVMVVELRQA
jgi:exosortase